MMSLFEERFMSDRSSETMNERAGGKKAIHQFFLPLATFFFLG